MTRANVILVVVCGLMLIAGFVLVVLSGRRVSIAEDALKREWARRDSVADARMSKVENRWRDLEGQVGKWKSRMDSLEGLWWKASKEVKGLENWFKTRR